MSAVDQGGGGRSKRTMYLSGRKLAATYQICRQGEFLSRVTMAQKLIPLLGIASGLRYWVKSQSAKTIMSKAHNATSSHSTCLRRRRNVI
jgi:hypothetical protein